MTDNEPNRVLIKSIKVPYSLHQKMKLEQTRLGLKRIELVVERAWAYYEAHHASQQHPGDSGDSSQMRTESSIPDPEEGKLESANEGRAVSEAVAVIRKKIEAVFDSQAGLGGVQGEDQGPRKGAG